MTQPGGQVTYTVTVTNTGSAPFTADNPASFSDDLSDVLDDATYNNDATGGATVTGNTLNWSGPLDVGATATLTYSVTVNDPPTGDHHLRNAVTPGTGGVCTAPGECATDVPVIVTPPTQPSLALRKHVVTPGPFRVGDTVEYGYTVTNTGNTTIDGITVADNRVSGVTCQATTLAPGESTTCTGTYTVTAADGAAGHVINTAVARGQSDGTPVESPEANARIDIVTSRPALTIRKSVDTSRTYRVGDTVTYTYTVTNTGNTTLDDITVTDDRVSGITCQATTLAPGASTECTGTYTVTKEDADRGKITNTAVATADGGVRSEPAEATVKVEKRPCTGKDCNKPCHDKDCKPCKGKHCDKPCKDKHCHKPCKGKHDDKHCHKHCKSRDCDKK